ncbi:C-Jun-amino-terminal kinase-interacting protein 4-like isoform X2 [Nematostella vectensis]|uniref:C-Jun-amino-terminal kinase-interacting protein 4-like isoform X2 n=1 Tax=Nematostella vectensis TaxID=45351 RepID=UPI0020778764|nr:C-Jun-amino-terminal kinase-interacting protein 4-like isoform X2 [Nematostella vectensis]
MEVDDDTNEAVYSSGEEGGTTVMSERVSNLANSIYSEFERMIQKYDQDVVSGLMPLMVSVLEQLDSAYGDNNEQLVELEILSDDNEQLITQYEREKQLRKLAENRYLEIEDQIEAEKRNAEKDIESLEHDNRGLEARIKSYQDHVERLEERISEMKREYGSLHQRHSEVVQHYMERIERAEKRSIASTETPQKGLNRLKNQPPGIRSPIGPPGSSVPELSGDEGTASPVGSIPKSPEADMTSPPAFVDGGDKNVLSLRDESMTEDATSSTGLEKSQGANVDGLDVNNSTCSISDVDNLPIVSAREAANMLTPGSSDVSLTGISKDAAAILASTPELSGSNVVTEVARREKGSSSANRPVSLDLENLPEGVAASSLFAELSSEEPDVIGQMDTGADIIAMGRELENVMKENKELVTVKNKLETQKNDLLKRLEELSNDKEVMTEELKSLQEVKQRMNIRVTECEHELKRTKHEAEKATVALKEASVSAAHRKRFTRVEMARVLMERNQYKERLMELQEAVRWTEMIRASKERNLELQQKKKSSIWKFFSNLFGPTPRARPNPSTVSIRYNSGEGQGTPPARRHNSLTNLNTGSNMSGGYGSENFDRQRLNERRERYKQVRAYLNTDLSEGRMQAYGWSLPAKYSSEVAEGGKSLVSVPVPVYCRPLNLSDPGMKIWCAAGVDLSGGYTSDGGAAIGASVFYADSPGGEDVEIKEAKPSTTWIGSSTHSCSKITIIDANYPQNILDCFVVCTSHLLCITAVPGASPGDYDAASVGDGARVSSAPQDSQTCDKQPVSDSPTVTDVSTSESDRVDARSADGEGTKMSSVLPTMWLGAQSGCVYVHSAISQWRTCIQSIRLKDSVLSIVHVKGRVLVALADGTVAIFHRSSDGQWNFNNYHLLDLGRPHHSIRCMAMVHDKVWCGYRNKIQVIHPRTMRVEKTFDAHPRRESQVRQLAWIGDGVWVSIRLDSTLRLYNAQTYHHLQDIDIEPYVSKMLGTGKLGFSFVRITSLLLTNDRLWVGTGNGVILSVPLVAARPARDDGDQQLAVTSSPAKGGPGGPVRVYSNEGKDGDALVSSSSFMPYCSMVNAQLSFHGHRDSVKFFVAVQGFMKRVSSSQSVSTQTQTSPNQTPPSSNSPEKRNQDMMLVLSGGEGYVDFRLGDGEEAAVEDSAGDLISVTLKGQSTSERSHIMVWQVASN